MGAWRHRVARDEDGRLRFVFARYDDADPYQRCGLIRGISYVGVDNDLAGMEAFARDLQRACHEPVISMAEYEREPDEDDEGEDEDDEFSGEYGWADH